MKKVNQIFRCPLSGQNSFHDIDDSREYHYQNWAQLCFAQQQQAACKKQQHRPICLGKRHRPPIPESIYQKQRTGRCDHRNHSRTQCAENALQDGQIAIFQIESGNAVTRHAGKITPAVAASAPGSPASFVPTKVAAFTAINRASFPQWSQDLQIPVRSASRSGQQAAPEEAASPRSRRRS